MRVLVLSPFVPYPPRDGGRIRIGAIVRHLAQRHDVRLLALRDDSEKAAAAEEAFRGEGFDIKAIPHRRRRTRTVVRSLAAGHSLYLELYRSRVFSGALAVELEEGFDVVQCEFPYMGQYRMLMNGARPQARWVLDEHNVEFRLAELLSRLPNGRRSDIYRLYADREVERRRREEIAIARSVDHVLVVSEPDRAALAPLASPTEVSIVPNGVDIPQGSPVRTRVTPSTPPSAVFIGKLDYRPNSDGVEWFCSSVLPLIRHEIPGFRFEIVGAAAPRRIRALTSIPGVVLRGEVTDTLKVLRAASVAIVPLRAGSGTRLKVLEALAARCPVVSTTVGSEGLELESGVHLDITDEPESFADAVVALSRDSELVARRAAAGYARVAERYAWSSVLGGLDDVYERLAGRSSS